MSTTYTTIWRLAVMTPGDPSVTGTWGATRNSGLSLYEQGAVGNTPISIAAQTTYTLTTANNASDQARLAMYNFTGALTGDCTVTMPSIARIGWATNSTTGGHNVILTTGSGTTLTLLPGLTYFWTCDGTNVASASLYSGAITASSLTVSGNASIGGTLGVTGAATLSGGASVTGNLSASGVASFGSTGNSVSTSGYVTLPGGLVFQWGVITAPATNNTIAFPLAFGTACYGVDATLYRTDGLTATAGVGVSSLTKTGCVLSTGVAGTNYDLFWKAIGV